jgi:outer membrane immunogenic protein
MKRVVLAGIGVFSMLALGVSANAADLPRRQAMPTKAPAYVAYNWTGRYVGLNGGWGFGTSGFRGVPGTGNFDTDGGMIGGTIGYNWQFNQFVFGLEGDIDWSNNRGSAACGGLTCTTRNNYFGTARGRIGYAFDRFLPYITGGLAVGDIEARTTGFPGATDDRAGWTVGAGAEFAISGPLTAKVEYLYADLGRFDCSTACTVTPPQRVDFRTSVVRAGLNYRF